MARQAYCERFETPAGPLHLSVDESGALVEILLPNRRAPKTTSAKPTAAALDGMRIAKSQLSEYFRGERRCFELRLAPRGSSFEQRVWSELRAIPYGRTISYGEIARKLELENGARAVGRANGANPIPIVIPCHRVIGTNGSLVGFGGGLALKRKLLELEEALEPPAPSLFEPANDKNK